MDDVNIGTFASAGQTPLATISSADPLYVQLDMSESEYLSLTKNKSGTETLGDTLKLRLLMAPSIRRPARSSRSIRADRRAADHEGGICKSG